MITSTLTFLIIGLAAYRVWKLAAEDVILDPLRDALLGTSRPITNGPEHYKRPRVAAFVGCPWCLGFWISLGAWSAYHWWNGANTVLIATPLALSALLGLVVQNLDE